MAEYLGRAVANQVMEQVVIFCGCSDAEKLSPEFHARHNAPCPKPRATKNLGVVAMWNRNPLRTLAWRMGKWIRGQRAGTAHFKQE